MNGYFWLGLALIVIDIGRFPDWIKTIALLQTSFVDEESFAYALGGLTFHVAFVIAGITL